MQQPIFDNTHASLASLALKYPMHKQRQGPKDAFLDPESNFGAMGEPSSKIAVPQTEYLIAFRFDMVSDLTEYL